MPFTQSFVRSQTKKKVIAHGHGACQEFSFLYRRSLKQMKRKRSSGNVLHLFLRLSVLLQSASSFEETAPDAAPDEEKMALRRTLQPNKNASNFENQKTPFAVAKKL